MEDRLRSIDLGTRNTFQMDSVEYANGMWPQKTLPRDDRTDMKLRRGEGSEWLSAIPWKITPVRGR